MVSEYRATNWSHADGFSSYIQIVHSFSDKSMNYPMPATWAVMHLNI
jgi:hypothetical protein